MCTIALLFQHHPSAPLVIAANRDELYARATSGPQRLAQTQQGRPIVGGRDEQAGGTWMGVTDVGFVVAITNQRTMGPPRQGARSRGALVMEALRCGATEPALALLRGADGRDYNGFNLLVGDAEALYVAYGRSDRRVIVIEPVTPGAHVLGNDVLDAPDNPKVQRVLRRLQGLDLGAALLPQLTEVLADHTRPALNAIPAPPAGHWLSRELLREVHATCIHTSGYGTRSATFASLRRAGVDALMHAPGPPCVTPWTDIAPLLD